MPFSPFPLADPQLPLREWACIHTQLDWIYDHEVPARYRDRPVDKQQGGYSAWYVRKGLATVETSGGRRLRAGPGSWLFVPAERIHQRFSADAHILSLHFLCQWPSGENILAGDAGLVFDGSEFPALESKATRLERMVRRHVPGAETHYASFFSDYEHFLSFHTVFLQWLAEWFRAQKKYGKGLSRLAADDDRLLRAIRVLNTSPLDQPLPHRTLQKASGLSEAHLNRLFVAEYGLTIRKSWDRRRLTHARTCLETTRMPVKEVAYRLGFRSDSHFMRWFKERTGMRPKEYRQNHREPDTASGGKPKPPTSGAAERSRRARPPAKPRRRVRARRRPEAS